MAGARVWRRVKPLFQKLLPVKSLPQAVLDRMPLAVALLILAWAGGLVGWHGGPDASMAVRLAASLFVAPALGEELLFRGLVSPRRGPQKRWIAVSTLLFVLWHPLQALTVGPPWSAAFLDPWFLAAVAVLGIALGRIYAATGSLWPCVVAHWLVVFVWKALLGGPF